MVLFQGEALAILDMEKLSKAQLSVLRSFTRQYKNFAEESSPAKPSSDLEDRVLRQSTLPKGLAGLLAGGKSATRFKRSITKGHRVVQAPSSRGRGGSGA